MQYTSGVDTGTNNAIVHKVSVVNGKVSVKTTLPPRVRFSDGITVGTLHPFLSADPDDGQGVDGGIRYYFELIASFPNVKWQVKKRFFTGELEFGFTIPPGAAPRLKLVVGGSAIANTTSPRVTVGFTNGEATIDLTAESVNLDGLSGDPIYVDDLPVTTDELQFVHYGKGGQTIKLHDKISLELPVQAWRSAATNPCSWTPTMSTKAGRQLCKWFMSNTKCRRLVDTCNGYRDDCVAYVANDKCDMRRAREIWGVGDEFLKVTEANLKHLFSKRTGFGYLAEGSIPGYNPEAQDGQEFGLLNSTQFADRSIFAMLVQAAVYGCHKFDSSIPDGCGRCYASNALELSIKRATDLPIWRYVKADGRLDLTYTSMQHVELKLKTEDVPVSYQGITAFNRDPQAKNYTPHFRPMGGFEPEAFLPPDLPDGQYEVWAYCRNTIGLDMYLAVLPPYSIEWQKYKTMAEHIGLISQNKDVQMHQFPVAANYGWVKLADNAVLADLARLSLFVDQKDPDAPAAFQSPGEFAIKSLYIERVR